MLSIGKTLKSILFIVLLGIFGMSSVCASTNGDSSPRSKTLEKFTEITGNKYGEPRIINEIALYDNSKGFLIEDDQYIYKIKEQNQKIQTIVIKNCERNVNVGGSLSLDKAAGLGDNIINTYNPPKEKCCFLLKQSLHKCTAKENYYTLIYYEFAPNGVKTGEGIAIDINLQGQLIGLAVHQGNADIAINTKPVITDKQAEMITQNAIKSRLSQYQNIVFPTSQTELTVWDNKLCWSISLEPIEAGNAEYGFIMYVNAINGNIEYDDYYCALN